MREKIYLYLFILVTIAPQGIFGKFLEDDNGESSNILDREKRVISRVPGEDVPLAVGSVPYVVNVRKNRRLHCMGSILSHRTVITAARCVNLEVENYEVLAGSTISTKGVLHNITHKAIHGHDASRSSIFLTGIALLYVFPPFTFRTTVYSINLFLQPIYFGITGDVTGWGNHLSGRPNESSCSNKLRSITVPVINQQVCENIYRGHFPIRDEDFCTYHADRFCGYTDIGAPFVINNELVGVHIGEIDTRGTRLPIRPDIFVLLHHPTYLQWILSNIIA